MATTAADGGNTVLKHSLIWSVTILVVLDEGPKHCSIWWPYIANHAVSCNKLVARFIMVIGGLPCLLIMLDILPDSGVENIFIE